MQRISMISEDAEGPDGIVGRIRARRGGKLLKMDRIMLHSRPFSAGWNVFLGAVDNELNLAQRLREFVMCVVGVLNRADYQVLSHASKFIAAGGTRKQLEALSDISVAMRDEVLFDVVERAVLRLTFEMTRNVEVTNEALVQARATMQSERELVELIGVIATYNMVSRLVVAFGLGNEDGQL